MIAPATQKPIVGGAIAERASKPRRRWPLVLGLLLLGGGGAAVAVYVTTQAHENPEPGKTGPATPVTGPATVKFDVTPADSEIRIDGTTHTGSPWSTELAAGTHQIEIHRSNYTAYLTTLELAPADKHSMHIELRPLGTAGATTEATLSVATTPSGLDAELDGVPLAQHTPIKVQIKPGAHTIVVKRAGVEVWRQRVNAEAASEYEFSPSFAPQGAMVAPPQTQPQQVEATVKRPDVTIEQTTPIDANTKAVETTLVPAPMPEKPVVPAPPPAPMPAGPVTVAPNAVHKISGDAPNVAKKGYVIPAVAAAKVCIDTAGAVSSVDFVGKIDQKLSADLGTQLKAWKYQPYLQAGAPVSACFVVTMRMK
ncbi:MAG: PEGA domain-containing protein [Kofleriaceae bacterium]